MDIKKGILEGNILSAARMISMIENDREEAANIIKEIFPYTGNAYLIGVTGSPGVGKSTLVSQMIKIFRDRGKTVGVIAVDSSSPFSGGALLGDRIRMQEHEMDPEGVFVRSMATRGNLGGLSKATRDAAYVMDAMGREIIIIETVGVGQVELDIVKTAYTTVVILAPGMGDTIQAMKAGIMEIGDIFIVNKADHEGVEETLRDVEYMLNMGADEREWHPDVYKTIAAKGEGVEDFIDGIEKHRKYLEDADLKLQKVYGKEQLLDLLKERVERRIMKDDKLGEEFVQEYVKKIIQREIDPYTVSEIMMNKIGL
ncbi:MAG: methylmalonyl Co-A mutase-associated GTPase MeaB [Spirochaetota bacterium]|nr:methylmalonyl Co-A mutase-associated GTPase MeaB [Spirochaetota bacterium]